MHAEPHRGVFFPLWPQCVFQPNRHIILSPFRVNTVTSLVIVAAMTSLCLYYKGAG